MRLLAFGYFSGQDSVAIIEKDFVPTDEQKTVLDKVKTESRKKPGTRFCKWPNFHRRFKLDQNVRTNQLQLNILLSSTVTGEYSTVVGWFLHSDPV